MVPILKKAKDILLRICADNGHILEEPIPEVYVGELAESSVNLSLRFWAHNDVFWPAHFYVLEELKYRFDEAGIEIPFPQRVVHEAGYRAGGSEYLKALEDYVYIYSAP